MNATRLSRRTFLAGAGLAALALPARGLLALASTTPGDTSMATRREVEKQIGGGGARVVR